MILGLALAWAAILVGCWLGWQLLRQNGRILLRLDELEKRLDQLEFGGGDEPEGLSIGSEAPAFELPDLAGQRKSLAQYRGQRILLIFFNPACGFCRDLAPKLVLHLSEKRAPRVTDSPCTDHGQGLVELGPPGEGKPLVLVISTGEVEANRALFAEHQLDCPVLLQKEMEVAAAYKANGTPGGYLIDSTGKIASELAMGGEALLTLLEGKPENEKQEAEMVEAAGNGKGRASRFSSRSLARSKLKRDGLKAGTVAPDFRLPRLDGGGELGLSELRGRRVLLFFSSPTCGPCLALAPQLEKFHRDHPEVEVVMVSKGEPKENRAKVKEHGLTFPVVLQQQWEISRRYAMFATPVAYLIDEAGIIAQDIAVGVEPILALMAYFERAVSWFKGVSYPAPR